MSTPPVLIVLLIVGAGSIAVLSLSILQAWQLLIKVIALDRLQAGMLIRHDEELSACHEYIVSLKDYLSELEARIEGLEDDRDDPKDYLRSVKP